MLYTAVFPKLCAAAYWCAAEEAEVWRESFMFWQNLLYVTSLPLQSLWRVGFYKVGAPRPNLVFISVPSLNKVWKALLYSVWAEANRLPGFAACLWNGIDLSTPV